MATEDFSTLSGVYHVLTDELVSKALSDWFKETITFTHWEYVGETGKGDSYLSEVMRIKVFGKNNKQEPKHVQIILKSIPRSVSRRLTFRSHDFFKNEIVFYESVLPALLNFQDSKNVADPFVNYTKLFLTYCDGSNDIICLEDASLEAFGSAVRQEGIDIEHSRLTFKIMAKFHALSFAMKDQEPEEFERISNLVVENYYDDRLWGWYAKFWDRMCGIAIDAVEKEFPNTIYAEKVKKFAVPETYRECIKAAKTRKTGVISHGDSWTNNFLYKYVNGSPVDAKIIDFQLTRCASPVLDISFVIYACTTQDMRLKHYDDLLKYYYEVLSSQIKAYGSDPENVYSWDLFMEEVKRYSFFGLAFSFESTPFIVLDPEDAVNMEMEMGIFFCKASVPAEYPLSYTRFSDALTKWFGEPATFAHAIWPESLATSYISEVKRVKVCAQRTTGAFEYVHGVLKSYPRNKSRGRSFRSDDFFKNEIVFYENTLPGLLRIQESFPYAFDSFARLFFTYQDGERFFVVTGDARTEGFETGKTDMEHGKLVLSNLAKFHAISFALKYRDLEQFEKLSKEVTETYYSNRFWGWYREVWCKTCDVAIDAVEKEYPGTKYVGKVKEFAVANRYKELIKAVNDRKNGVILHGNCRPSNYLFKCDNDKPIRVKMVDFQQTRYASPVLDVSSIFYTNKDLLKDYDGLLRYYHGVLSSYIIEFGGDPNIYTWDVFKEDIQKYSFFGLAFSFEVATTAANKEIDWKSKKVFNIADILEVKDLTNQERFALAANIRHCTDHGYI